MYLECLRDHGLAVIGVSDAWDALSVAPRADVIVTGILLASSMDGVELMLDCATMSERIKRPSSC